MRIAGALAAAAWAAVFSSCAAPAGAVRKEAGPFHSTQREEGRDDDVAEAPTDAPQKVEGDVEVKASEIDSERATEAPRMTAGSEVETDLGEDTMEVDSQGDIDPRHVGNETVGDIGRPGYRRYSTWGRHRISPWHDLPLRPSDDSLLDVWMVTEVPKRTSGKYGMSQFEPMNPIAANLAQNRQLRHFKQTSFYNYGFLPQTWSDPSQVNRILNIKGDNGPLDVVDISDRQNHRGQVTRVRILGALALMDHGELDWKILALDINDPLASRLKTLSDVDEWEPQVVVSIREWFRINEAAGGGDAVCQERALEVVHNAHSAWRRLVEGDVDPGDLWVGDAAERKARQEAASPEEGAKAPPGFEGVNPKVYSARSARASGVRLELERERLADRRHRPAAGADADPPKPVIPVRSWRRERTPPVVEEETTEWDVPGVTEPIDEEEEEEVPMDLSAIPFFDDDGNVIGEAQAVQG